jgi:hypothetical protein
MSNLAPACTYKHVIIFFHNTLTINFSTTYIFFYVYFQLANFFSKYFLPQMNELHDQST